MTQIIKTIGIIGGGQLGLMLAESALRIQQINKIIIYSNKKQIPCNLLLHDSRVKIIYGSYDNNTLFENFCKSCDVITYEFESINTELLNNSVSPIYPKTSILEIIQDKYIQKKYLQQHNLPVGAFCKIESKQTVEEFIQKHQYPILIKSRFGSFDGRGNKVIKIKKI